MKNVIADVYNGLDISVETYPPDDIIDPKSYMTAIDNFPKGSVVIIFTPDDTHFEIALYAIKRGLHVLVFMLSHASIIIYVTFGTSLNR